MKNRLWVTALLLALTAGNGASLRAQSTGRRGVDSAVAQMGGGFTSGVAEVNGTALHYVRGGAGPAILLIHGFPQDWYEWRKVMPILAKEYTVVAMDLRGAGGSRATNDGYDVATMAEDVYQLAQKLKLERPYVAGHDIGGMVAYAYARLHPDYLRGVLVLECPIPGVEPWEKIKAEPLLWHINFQETPDLPEQLVAGRQAIYFGRFFKMGTVDNNAITAADLAHYVKAYSAPAQLRAAFEVYRALPGDEKFDNAHREAISVPLVLSGGDGSFGKIMPGLKDTLRDYGWQNVTVEVLANLRHYIPDEQPGKVAKLIGKYAGT
jgi:pimeloyl-ACP methyl ester carboxylesterase